MSTESQDVTRHMCALKILGREESIEKLSDQPRVTCRYCGAQANSIRNICIADFETIKPARPKD